MKVAKLYSFHDIRIEDAPIPEVGPRDALIKTKACGICSGDVMPWYIEKKAPLVIGHEPAGEIVEVGREVVSFKNGDRVFVHHHAPCLVCGHCSRGNYVHCETWKKTNLVPGGVSEYILVSGTHLAHDTIKLHEDMTYEDATLIEPVACVIKSLNRLRVRGGETALVIGLGVMGQIHTLLLRERGAERIIVADRVRFRLEKAQELGADDTVDVSAENVVDAVRRLTGGTMADLVIVGPGSIEAMRQGIAAAAAGGTVLLFTPSPPDEQLTISPHDLYFKDITITTSYSCGPPDTAESFRVIRDKIVTAAQLVTHRFPIEKTPEAFKLTSEAKNSLKCIITF